MFSSSPKSGHGSGVAQMTSGQAGKRTLLEHLLDKRRCPQVSGQLLVGPLLDADGQPWNHTSCFWSEPLFFARSSESHLARILVFF